MDMIDGRQLTEYQAAGTANSSYRWSRGGACRAGGDSSGRAPPCVSHEYDLVYDIVSPAVYAITRVFLKCMKKGEKVSASFLSSFMTLQQNLTAFLSLFSYKSFQNNKCVIISYFI